MDERKLIINWVGAEKNVKGNVSFTTERGAVITLTAEEIDMLYKASMEARENGKIGQI